MLQIFIIDEGLQYFICNLQYNLVNLRKKIMAQSIFTYNTIKLNHETIGKYSFPNHQIHITNAFDGHYNDINLSDQNLHTHDFYMLTWVECGNFEYTFGIEKYHIDSSTLLLIAPGDIHSYYSDCVIEGFSIFFTENFFVHYQKTAPII